MRIISGHNRGRKIKTPPNLPVRPTTDFAKEGLFNILANRVNFETLNVLDLFAGTGNISFEFASRGAVSIKSIDTNNQCVEFIRRTAVELKFENLRSIKSNAFKFLSNAVETFDLIFADPPYDLEEAINIPDLVFENELLNDDGILIVEHARNLSFSDHYNFTQHRKYGNVNFSFFEKI